MPFNFSHIRLSYSKVLWFSGVEERFGKLLMNPHESGVNG